MFSKNSRFMGIFAGMAMLGQALSLQATTVTNNTPAPMVVVGQYPGGAREDILSYIKGGDTETVNLSRVPETVIARDTEFKWTNVPELFTGVYSLAELNNATIVINKAEGSQYRPNAPWDITLDLELKKAAQQQAEIKQQRAQLQAAAAPAAQSPAWLSQALAQGQAQPASAAPANIQAMIRAHQQSVGAEPASYAHLAQAAPVQARPAVSAAQAGRPATEAPLAIRKQILAHQKQMGVDPREYADLEQSIIADEGQATPKKLLSAQQEAALSNFAQQFIRKSEEIRAALQKRFANAKSIKQLGKGDWMVALPDNLIKIVDASGTKVLKTISKGQVFVGDYTPVKKSASEAETADEAAEALV